MPLVGVKPVTERVTVKFVALVAVPDGVVTVMRPVLAPSGTVAVMCVCESTVKPAARPLNLTEVAPVRFVPVMPTEVPVGPEAGENPEMVGAEPPPPPPPVTVKLVALVVVLGVPKRKTLIGPVVAPAGTVAFSCVDDSTWVVASFAQETGNVWSNPELTCQHVDPQTKLAPKGRAVVETKVLVLRGSLDNAFEIARRERQTLRLDPRFSPSK